MRKFWFLACLSLCACDKKLERPPAPAIAIAPVHAEPPQTPPPEEHIAEGMGLLLRAHPKRTGEVELLAANATREPIRVQPRLAVERRTTDGWVIVEPLSNVSLRHDCERPPSECVTLAPGAELFPPAWLGKAGDAQCACTGCGADIQGELRFVAMSCNMRTRYNSEPFTR